MAAENEHVGDCPQECVEEEEAGKDPKNFFNLNDVFNALKSQQIYEHIANLPPDVQKRIKALKRIQLEATELEAKFFEEVHTLECKYHELYTPLYEKRTTIVKGSYEPNEEECKWEDSEEISKGIEKLKLEDKEKEPPKDTAPVKGIPDFWLTIFKNVGLLADMVQEHDEAILKHLTDIKANFHKEPMGFTLQFYFEPNEYFTNNILTKHYEMKCSPDDDDPFSFEGPEIIKCTGCTINWNKGKDVTKKTIKKKQKHKSRGVVRTVAKVVANDSFFNFFSPPTIPDDINAADVDEELRNLITSDFEIGHYIRDRIIPRAVLFFTGEGIEENEDDDYEEESEEEEDESGEDTDFRESENEQNCKQQ